MGSALPLTCASVEVPRGMSRVVLDDLAALHRDLELVGPLLGARGITGIRWTTGSLIGRGRRLPEQPARMALAAMAPAMIRFRAVIMPPARNEQRR
jgi:hypothetical protein